MPPVRASSGREALSGVEIGGCPEAEEAGRIRTRVRESGNPHTAARGRRAKRWRGNAHCSTAELRPLLPTGRSRAPPTAIRALGSRVFRPALHAAGRLWFAGAPASIVKQLVLGAETKNAPPAGCAGGASGRSRGAGRSYGTVPSHPARSCPVARPQAGRPERISLCRSLTRLIDSSRSFIGVEARPTHHAARNRETPGVRAARHGLPLCASL